MRGRVRFCWKDEEARTLFEHAGLHGFDELLAMKEGELVTRARTRKLCRFGLGGRVWYLKVQDLRGRVLPPRKWPSYLFRGSPLVREARSLLKLAELGIRTPALAAAGFRQGLLLPEAAILLTRELEGHTDLRTWLGGAPEPGLRESTLQAVDRLLAEVHRKGWVLLGAKYRNILLPLRGARGPEDLALIDQPNLRQSRSRRLRRKDRRLLERDRRRYAG